MKKISILILFAALAGCRQGNTGSVTGSWDEIGYTVDSIIKPGIPAYNDTVLKYSRDGNVLLTVTLSEPSIAGVASKPEKWGFFQFPDVGRLSFKIQIQFLQNDDKHSYSFALSEARLI